MPRLDGSVEVAEPLFYNADPLELNISEMAISHRLPSVDPCEERTLPLLMLLGQRFLPEVLHFCNIQISCILLIEIAN